MRKILSLLIAVVLGVSTAFATTVYCKMTYGWWTQDGAAVAVHYWGGESAGTTWPGARMEAVAGDEGAWSYDVPEDVEGLMFVRVNGSGDIADWGAKTVNLTLPTDGKNLFTITNESESWGDPGCNGEWSVYGEGGGEEAQMDTIYTWYGKRGESSATEAIEAGGTAAAYGGNSNVVVGTAQKTNWTIKLNKGFSSGTYYVGITLDEALAAGDKLQVAAFRTSGSDAIFGIDFSADEASAATTCQVLFPNNLQTITTNAAPEDTTFTIPECAAGAKFIRIYRNSGSTGVYVANFTILREKGETPEPPVEDPAKFYITGDAALLGELAWNPAAIKVTEDSYTFENLAAGDYKLKVTLDGTWGDGMVKGFSDLTTVADGLTADGDGNICFTLAEAGNVVVTYTAEAFTLAGNFYVEPQPQGCDWDNIEYLGDGSPEQTFGNQFKVCKPEGMSVVNIQKPEWAAESGIYMTFPSAAFGTISLAEGQYVINGAGIVFYCSAFTEEYTEVTVNCEGNDIVFTVYNAKAVTPVEHTYTVAGGSDVAFGTAWDPSNTANDMVLVEGLYTWEKADLTLAAGSIGFKVCEDHAWTTAYPAQDYQLAIPEAGIYTITITFNADSKEVNAVATKTGSAVVIPTIAMHGNFLGSWADTENFTVAEGDATASLTLNLAAGNYEFGMRIGGSGNWTANGAAFTRENAAHVIEAGSGNLTLAADEAGEYTFTWTFETNTLSIVFPTATAISNTATDAEAVKVLHNGMLLIRKGDKTYTIMGQAVK